MGLNSWKRFKGVNHVQRFLFMILIEKDLRNFVNIFGDLFYYINYNLFLCKEIFYTWCFIKNKIF